MQEKKRRYGIAASLVLALFVGVFSAGQALAVAPTWQVIRNSDCTAGTAAAVTLTNARVNCCYGGAAAGGSGLGYCEQVDMGNTFPFTYARRVTLATSPAAVTYTTGGDAIGASELAKITQPATWVAAQCYPTAGTGYFPTIKFTSAPPGQRTPFVQFWSGTGELSNAVSLASTVIECIIYGY